MRTAIVDADILVYMAALNAEYEWEIDEYIWALWAELPKGIARLKGLVKSIQEATQADRLVMALTDYETPNWRYRVMPTYKSNRKKTRRPIIWKPLRAFIEEEYESFTRPTLEGDDIVGILMTNKKVIQGEKIAVSIDKDLMTIPGLHYSLKQIRDGDFDEPRIFEITEAMADRFHMIQSLAGDQVDGFGGCPGYGMKSAVELLEAGRILTPRQHRIQRGKRKGEVETRWEPGPFGDDWDIIVSAYQSAGLNEEVALQNARVARICRSRDYDYIKKEVKLWTPTSAA